MTTTGRDRLLHQAVGRAARARPDAPAIVDGERTVTYAALDRAASHVAAALAERGVGPGDRVGVWAPKGALAIASLIGINRLGAAYVPLDAQSPPARVQKILDDCALAAALWRGVDTGDVAGPLVSLEALGGDALFDRPRPARPAHPAPPADAGSLAYILYTSGTTGTPKGVCVSHRAALAFVDWCVETLGIGPEDRLSSHAPLHFDLSVFDLYAAFHAGARVCLVPAGASLFGAALVDFALSQRITIWYSVPTALVMMIDGLAAAPGCPLRAVLFAGEVFPIKHLRRLQAALPGRRLLNLYGPTESNVCTWYEVHEIEPERTAPVPIGRASCGDTVVVLGPDGQPAPPGEPGELWVSGPTMMTGYWGRPPLAGPYATGDIVRALPGGDLEYIGRRDHMVKLRGHRVELGDVEAALLEHPAVREACALVSGAGASARLVAFLACEPDAAPPSLLKIKAHCRARLPRYMIVDAVRRVDALPRTRNGKVARRELARTL